MSSKARTVEHGGVDWKIIPGSRREQLLMRMIRQDNALNHADVEPFIPGPTLLWQIGFWIVVSGAAGFAAGLFVLVIQRAIA